ncbi:uncharacterized protein SPSK_10833 [Sporothrix schenckii 1099-18]|uniref:Uncharacterized protein n=1 Tax=Sporothrix schenckii 1099-18 TaxID=1397361 RepID=A0A0F2MFJ0_SPOSC|nr:uncharacterized protein SPSK_10833 [Sporothrix schenckii 1099-18]KJR88407.1 hypothetical protein SPSK_10833 [Sporothrix schenckii 1099-18]
MEHLVHEVKKGRPGPDSQWLVTGYAHIALMGPKPAVMPNRAAGPVMVTRTSKIAWALCAGRHSDVMAHRGIFRVI